MNLAVSTVVVFLFLVPGILFRKFYYSDEFSAQYFKESFLGVVLSSFLPSLVIQFVWSSVIAGIGGPPINLDVVFDLLTTSPVSKDTIENLHKNGASIFWYNLGMFCVSSLSGWTCRYLIRSGELDRKYSLLRFKNHWHYLLSGEFFDIPRAAFDLFNDDVSDIEIIYVDALVETKEGTIIYDGVLVKHELTGDGTGLEYIVLKEVERRFLKSDSQSATSLGSGDIDETIEASSTPPTSLAPGQNPYYSIPGHIMIIPSSSIINMNITYYRIEEDFDSNGIPTLAMIQVS